VVVLGPLGSLVTTVVYNTTGRWWPMVAWLAVYVPLLTAFAVYVARTRHRPIRSFVGFHAGAKAQRSRSARGRRRTHER
jgi:hypothetical protein